MVKDSNKIFQNLQGLGQMSYLPTGNGHVQLLGDPTPASGLCAFRILTKWLTPTSAQAHSLGVGF